MTEYQHLNVLYVEDDPNSQKLMRLILSGRMNIGTLTVFEDSTDFAARVAALEPKPDVVFLDIHVKPYTGFEMFAILRQFAWCQHTPIVALTASVMAEETQLLRKAGFSNCLAKPLKIDAFPDYFARILKGESVWRIID